MRSQTVKFARHRLVEWEATRVYWYSVGVRRAGAYRRGSRV